MELHSIIGIIFLIANLVAIEITWCPRIIKNNKTGNWLLFYNSSQKHKCRKYIKL